MTEQEVLQALSEIGAILTEIHVCLTPKEGRWFHSDGYVAKDQATKNVLVADELYCEMGQPWLGVEVVVGPALGAIAIAHGVARNIAKAEQREIIACYTETVDPSDKASAFRLGRGFEKDVAGRKVLVVEDVLTSGGSAKRTIEAVRAAGGDVIGLAVMANRGGVGAEQVGGVKISALVNIADMQTWPEAECPLCADLVPLRVDIGKGRDWLKTEVGQAWIARGGKTIPA